MESLMNEANLDGIDLLKVDVEGAEVEMFRGDATWLSRIGCLAIEFHGDSRRESRFDEHLRRYGFRVLEDGPHTTVATKA